MGVFEVEVIMYLFLGLALRLPSGLRQKIKGVYVLPEGVGGVCTYVMGGGWGSIGCPTVHTLDAPVVARPEA